MNLNNFFFFTLRTQCIKLSSQETYDRCYKYKKLLLWWQELNKQTWDNYLFIRYTKSNFNVKKKEVLKNIYFFQSSNQDKIQNFFFRFMITLYSLLIWLAPVRHLFYTQFRNLKTQLIFKLATGIFFFLFKPEAPITNNWMKKFSSQFYDFLLYIYKIKNASHILTIEIDTLIIVSVISN